MYWEVAQMVPITNETGFAELDKRRRELGMSRAAVARLAGVSEPTVTRILTDKEAGPTLPVMCAIAAALRVEIRLGETIKFASVVDADVYRTERARKKAVRLVSGLQGSMGLESQAVDSQTLNKMIDRTTIELLAGSKRKLWED
jgi:transcriptional regulator with XRE-family HTH domain